MGLEQILELLLAGSPDVLMEARVAASPEDQADLALARRMLAELAFATKDVTPPASLRERILAKRPRPVRPQRPAVVVLDMIQDYLNPGGPLEVPRARAIVPALKARLEAARRDKIPVVYVCDTHAADDPDLAVWPLHALEGTPGADVWPEIAPLEGDVLIRKPTYSAFERSRLGEVLDEMKIDQIILTGCATEIGIFATAVDALQRGFAVTVPPDCQAGGTELGEKATLVALSAMAPYAPRFAQR
jgi:nicotinamidase-related amidase